MQVAITAAQSTQRVEPDAREKSAPDPAPQKHPRLEFPGYDQHHEKGELVDVLQVAMILQKP